MIVAENLSMNYGPIQALDNVSFEIKKGEIIGLLGPNGAGKSTTLKIITTYIYPSAGEAYVVGKSVKDDPIVARTKIGYLPESLPLYTDMEVQEYLKFVGRARGLDGKELEERLDWVIDKCALKPMFHKNIRELSKGYKQRTGLAQALIHDPEIVILDEPTSGLDPHQILEIRALIRELADAGKTIIFSTHILQEVEAVSNRVIIINRGKIVADGSLPEIRAKIDNQIELHLSAKLPESEVSAELKKLAGVQNVSSKDNGEEKVYYITYDKDSKIRVDLSELVRSKSWELFELRYNKKSLEEIFLHLTKNANKAKGVG